MARRWGRHLGVAVILGALVSLVGCAGADSSEAPTDELPGLSDFQRRCAALDTDLHAARVIYEPRVEMVRGESSLLSFAVTLDETTAADEILEVPETDERSGYLVSCRLQARLVSSPYDFEISEGDWVDRSFATADTARWSWYVTPKVGGEGTLLTEVRPILHLEETDGGVVTSEDLESAIQEFRTTATVSVPWTERPQETMTRLAKTLQVAEGLIQALTGVAVALAGLLTALGIRKLFRRRARTDDSATVHPDGGSG